MRGPTKIKKKVWTGESEPADIKISYKQCLELRERLEEMMKLAQEELKKTRSGIKRIMVRKRRNNSLVMAKTFWSCYQQIIISF